MNIFDNGSKWLKADFHLHTKADKEFVLPSGYNEKNFVADYLSALKSAGIELGIITNHNKFDVNEYKALKRAAAQEDIFLLAGVELSVNDGANGVHVLVVFDFNKWCVDPCNNYIEQFLTAAFEGIHNRENENTRCKYNLTELLEKLDEHRHAGRDSFIIMGHIEQASGFLQEFDGGRISQLAQTNKIFRKTVLGFQKLRTNDNISRLETWYNGNPLPAFVEGSDCKALSDVGKMGTQKDEKGTEIIKECYIKIGGFNFEAVKYSLKDKMYRVSSTPVTLTNGHIKSIAFVGGKYDGQNLPFSREMNSIIGIRGSGKSAILEVLRHALNIDYGAKVADKDYKDGLIGYTLGSGGKVIIELETQGHTYRYEKIYNQSPALYQDDQLIDTVSIDTLINKPIYFGQKDLSSSGMDFEADLIRRLTGTKLAPARLRIEQKKKEIESLITDIKRSGDIKQQKEQAETRKKDILHKLNIFKEKGLEEKLKKEACFGEDLVKLKDIHSKLEGFISDIKTDIDEYELFFSHSDFKSQENQDLFDKAKAVFEKVGTEYNRLSVIHKTSQGYLDEFVSIISELTQRNDKLKEEFAEIKREIKLPQINPDDFAKLNTELKTIELKLADIENNSKKKEELKRKLGQSLTELKTLWHSEYTALKTEINKFNSNSVSLKIEIEFQGRRDKFKEILKNSFRGTRLNDNHYENIITSYADFIEIFKDQTQLRNILKDTLFSNFAEKFKENMAELLTYRVEDKFTIKYHDKSLSEHSLGQRASALILFLLAQEDSGLIIIDQPEDDLDNQTIYDDVIKVLRKLKGKIQFIFATHNANIPVLGDSEQIITCSCQNEIFSSEVGSIDNHHIQKKIVTIMEGGEEAFNRRREIYESWKQ